MLDGSPNPLHGVVAVSSVTDPDLQDHVLYLEAPKAIDWEVKLSLPDHQAAGILTALGLQLGPHPAEDAVQRLKNQKDDREEKASPSIGGYPNICKWSLWPA